MGVSKECPHCKKVFTTPPPYPNQIYCCRQCYLDFKHANRVRPEKVCPYCEETFRSVASDNRVFCSTSCARKGKTRQRDESKYAMFTCEQCGTEFEYRIWRKPRFCSSPCYGKWMSKNLIGKAHPAYIDRPPGYYWRGSNWQAQRRKARKRDSHTCQHCGKFRAKGEYAHDVHHITPFRSFTDYKVANHLDNLITLCRPCHSQLEQPSN